jgi:hypothetical protein
VEHFVVEKVMSARRLNTKSPRFLIRWWSYTEADDTWEPLDCLDHDPFAYPWEDDQLKAQARALAHKWVAA